MPAIISDDRGAVDLQSTMVTVIVLAALFGAITLSVFKAIPWVQDVVTQTSLSAVAEAQNIQRVMNGSYVNEGTLVASGLVTQKDADRVDARALEKPWDGKNRATRPTGNHFVITMKSGTGTTFLVHDGDTKATGFNPTPGKMTTTWDTSLAPHCQEITLPISDLTGSVTWGSDGNSNQTSHTFTGPGGPVQITIDGTFYSWGYEGWEDVTCLVSVDTWGDTGTEQLPYAFSNADNLKHVAQIPSTTKNLRHAFSHIGTDFTIGALDTSNASDLSAMFYESSAFNQPVPFDTSSATTLNAMFYGNLVFNQPVDFDTSNVVDMINMFRNNKMFNQPVNFETSKVTGMSYMFMGTERFNQPLNFDTSSVTIMTSMFHDVVDFDQPLSFDTSQVTIMHAMFKGAKKFNQPLNFDTSKVTTMYTMFSGATMFNQPLNFDTSKVTDMSYMFENAAAFNQNLAAWKVANVTAAKRTNFSRNATSWVLPQPAWTS